MSHPPTIPGPLGAPPLEEVVCGVQFDELRDLDPVLLGSFWSARQDEFPKRQIQPRLPIASSPTKAAALLGQLRVWFIAQDDEFLVQIQQDRFYFNWRRRGDRYPSFEDRGGRAGILSRLLSQFSDFCDFVRAESSGEVIPRYAEVTKVDFLREGTHWSDLDDLLVLVPTLSVFPRVAGGGRWSASASVKTDLGDDRTLSVALQMSGESGQRLVKAETTARIPTVGDELEGRLRDANTLLNESFLRLVPRDQMVDRFKEAP